MPVCARWVFLALALVPALHGQTKSSAWRADIDTLVARIERIHPRP